jgi:hypothetical protein
MPPKRATAASTSFHIAMELEVGQRDSGDSTAVYWVNGHIVNRVLSVKDSAGRPVTSGRRRCKPNTPKSFIETSAYKSCHDPSGCRRTPDTQRRSGSASLRSHRPVGASSGSAVEPRLREHRLPRRPTVQAWSRSTTVRERTTIKKNCEPVPGAAVTVTPYLDTPAYGRSMLPFMGQRKVPLGILLSVLGAHCSRDDNWTNGTGDTNH